MKARTTVLIAILAGASALSTACGNDINLFGKNSKPTPVDTAPPGWDPSFGNDKYFYFWRIGADQANNLKGRIWREPIDESSPPTEYWKGSGPNYKCVGCHSISKDGRYMNVVELTARTSIDFSLHTVDLTQDPPQEIVIGAGANPAATPPSGSFSSWQPVAVGSTSDRFVYATGQGGLQIASVSSGVLMTLVPVTADGEAPSMPSWGPDDRIYYAASRYGDPRIVLYQESEIWSVKADGTGKELVFSRAGKMAYFPEVSPNGKWLAFTMSPASIESDTFANTKAKVMILDLENGALLTPNDLDAVSSEGRSWATWSAKGNRLTCGTATAAEDTNGNHDSDVYEVDFDPITGEDFNARRVDAISTGEFEHIPRWSP